MVAEAIHYVLVGGSTADRNRRNINRVTLANFAAGETWLDLIQKDNVTEAMASGFTSIWFHNYAGTAGDIDPPNPYGTGVAPLDKNQARLIRYSKQLSPTGNQLYGSMIFEQAIQAEVEDFALFGITGTLGMMGQFISAMNTLSSSGMRIYTYQGRPAGDRKAADTYFPGYDNGSRYFDLKFLQSGVYHCVNSPIVGMGFDTTALDESPNDGSTHADSINLPYGDISYNLFRMIRDSGTYTYVSGFTNSFTNPSGRHVFCEATPRRNALTAWVTGYSCIANYWLFDNILNGSTGYYQWNEYAYTPVVLCLNKENPRGDEVPSGLYLDLMDLWYLASGYISSGFRAAVKANLMSSLGIDAAALPLLAALVNNVSEGDGGDHSDEQGELDFQVDLEGRYSTTSVSLLGHFLPISLYGSV